MLIYLLHFKQMRGKDAVTLLSELPLINKLIMIITSLIMLFTPH